MNLQERAIEQVLKNELQPTSAAHHVFLVRGKHQFVAPIKGQITNSRLDLYDPTITHWTPNTYIRTKQYNDFITGHTEDNLIAINTFVIDLDFTKVSVDHILSRAVDCVFCPPTFILKTPRGYQLYYVLSESMYVNKSKESLRVAKEIAANLKRALRTELPIDEGCNDFGFFRIPKSNGILHYTNFTASPQQWIQWSMQQTDDQYVLRCQDVASKSDNQHQEWFRALLSLKQLKGESGVLGRNNVMFTLALGLYADKANKQEALTILSTFNRNLESPLSTGELMRTINSAFSGKYQGPKKHYVSLLMEYYSPSTNISRSFNIVFTKHAKPRNERTRSHYDEWEIDLVEWIQNNLAHMPFLQTTQKEMIENLHIPSSTLNIILKNTKQILVKRTGKGRNARTYLSTVKAYIQYHIRQKKNKKNWTELIPFVRTESLFNSIQDSNTYKYFYTICLARLKRINKHSNVP